MDLSAGVGKIASVVFPDREVIRNLEFTITRFLILGIAHIEHTPSEAWVPGPMSVRISHEDVIA